MHVCVCLNMCLFTTTIEHPVLVNLRLLNLPVLQKDVKNEAMGLIYST